MIPGPGTRADLHCHSAASQIAKLGIQRSVQLPECATPPQELYELAKRRGMDFVTITDHDTIDGCLELADEPDCFISEELTAWFAGEPQAVHILCYGITQVDHEFLQANATELEACAAYLREREITCALAHPFFNVAAPLTPRHRRRLAELFPIWEVRNGARPRELNTPAALYVETRGGTGIGGSDDHAGVDIGRTYTETPAAATPEELLRHVREGNASARGDHGSTARWAHQAIAIATRTFGSGSAAADSGRAAEEMAGLVFELAQRVVADGDRRGGRSAGAVGPPEARALLSSWLESVGFDSQPLELLELMQADDFSHTELARQARRTHERRLRTAVSAVRAAAKEKAGYAEAGTLLVDALIPAIPYVPATAILGTEISRLGRDEEEPRRAALVVDGAASVHGVTRTVERIRELEVPGWEVEVIGTDAHVDRRLPAVAEVEVPYDAGLTLGVPSVPELASTLTEGRYRVIHVTAPGPAGVGALLAAKIAGIPVCGSYHTELAAYAGVRSGDPVLEAGVRAALARFYGACDVTLSPSPAADRSLTDLGVDHNEIIRWTRGVDTDLFDPALRDPESFPGEVKVLYAGRLTREKGVDLLADAFLQARERDPRLHLLLAGGGPEEHFLRVRLGAHATFLGWLDPQELARAYASSDMFLFCSSTDTYGQVVTEAQASGLPVVAVGEGGPADLIRDRRTGWLCDPEPSALAAAVAQLAASEFLRERISRAGLEAARERTWDASLAQLASGYGHALHAPLRNLAPYRTREVA